MPIPARDGHVAGRLAAAAVVLGLVVSCVPETERVAADASPGEAAVIPAAAASQSPGEPRQIIVREGHSLAAIARRYGVSERAIIDANQMQPPYRLTAGAQLLIPVTVQSGQSLRAVARHYHVPEDSIIAANGIKPPYKLAAGPLLVPVTVRSGQSLRGIALSHHVPEREIVAANRLKPPYRLIAGTQLIIPPGTTSPSGKADAAQSAPTAVALDKPAPQQVALVKTPPPVSASAPPAASAAVIKVAAAPSGAIAAEKLPAPPAAAAAPVAAPPPAAPAPVAAAPPPPGPIAAPPSAASVAAAPPPPSPAPSPAAAALPENEQRFIVVVQQARERYNPSAEEPGKHSLREWRKAAICQGMPSLAVTGWTGTIDQVSDSSDGKGALKVSIGPGIRVKTWESQLTDIGYDTRVARDSSLYRTIAAMKPGDRVNFSGTFLGSDADCTKVAGTTPAKSLTEPEFIFRFSSVSESR